MPASPRVLLALALGLGVVPTARADDKKPGKPAAEPGRTIVIQIDPSKLPPDVLKQLFQLAEKPTDKPGKPEGDPVKLGTKPTGDTKPGAEPVKPGTKPEKPGTKP